MSKGRLEAFSDGVIAIIITIMALELKVPHGADLLVLRPMIPVFISYILSFVFIGIYWNNHHHLLQAVQKVSGGVLWANLHLLFWLSLIPFSTAWMGENNFAARPVALYGVILTFSALAYTILTSVLVSLHGRGSTVAIALGSDIKGKASLMIYLIAVGVSFLSSSLAYFLYCVVALIWLIPDRRFERALNPAQKKNTHD